MGKHLSKRFETTEVVEILERYLSGEIGVAESLSLLKIKRRGFFKILQKYRSGENTFCLSGLRAQPPRVVTAETHQRILEELAQEKKLIEDPNNPIRFYNYSYVKNCLTEKYKLSVSLPTIINRAKKTVFISRSELSNPMTEKY